MIDNNIGLYVGGELQMEVYLNDKINRFTAPIIGYLEGLSIIVRTPAVDGRCVILREGLQVKGRLLSGNSIYGFTTKISTVAMKPYPHLHLQFPKEFESMQVREVERISICIPAKVTQVNQEDIPEAQSIDIIDVSARGALIRTRQSLAAVSDTITIKASVDFGEETKALTIPAIVRNERQQTDDETDEEYYLYGLQFDLKSPRDRLVVQGFVYEKILQARG